MRLVLLEVMYAFQHELLRLSNPYLSLRCLSVYSCWNKYILCSATRESGRPNRRPGSSGYVLSSLLGREHPKL